MTDAFNPKSIRRIVLFSFILSCCLPAWAATGSISASGNPCTIMPESSHCTASITWSSNDPASELWVVNRTTGNEAKVSGHHNGSADITWLTEYPGHTFEVRLSELVLDSLVAYGVHPTGSVNASPTSCDIPYGETNCSSVITWDSSHNDSELWVVNLETWNEAKVSGSASGSASVSWIKSLPGHRFEVRLNSHVLVETAAVYGVEESPPEVSQFRGGSNYFWHGIGTAADPECGRTGHGVIKYFNHSLVNSHLNTMYSNGMRSIRIGVHYDRSNNDYGNVLPLRIRSDNTFGISTAYIYNIDSLLALIISNGFERVEFAFFPSGESSPKSNHDTNLDHLVAESVDLFKQVIPVVESHGIPVYYDLFNEGIAYNSRPKEYAKKLWSAFIGDSYLSQYLDRSFISQILSNAWSARNRTPSMGYIYGSVFPQYYQFHIYDSSDSPGEIMDELESTLAQNGYPDRPWIIGETFYDDQVSASGIADGLISRGRQATMLLQWPVDRNATCSDNSMAAPLNFGSYLIEGF